MKRAMMSEIIHCTNEKIINKAVGQGCTILENYPSVIFLMNHCNYTCTLCKNQYKSLVYIFNI